jgi:hypothetical protein
MMPSLESMLSSPFQPPRRPPVLFNFSLPARDLGHRAQVAIPCLQHGSRHSRSQQRIHILSTSGCCLGNEPQPSETWRRFSQATFPPPSQENMAHNVPTVSDSPWAVGGRHRYDFGSGDTSRVCVMVSGGYCSAPHNATSATVQAWFGSR